MAIFEPERSMHLHELKLEDQEPVNTAPRWADVVLRLWKKLSCYLARWIICCFPPGRTRDQESCDH